jgi:shikimate kinase / 3-dehydroquinate synthase
VAVTGDSRGLAGPKNPTFAYPCQIRFPCAMSQAVKDRPQSKIGCETIASCFEKRRRGSVDGNGDAALGPQGSEASDPLSRALGARSVVLVGMMGAGKTSIGKRLAQRLGLPFFDADTEIERAAGMTVPEIFEKRGEAEFRQGEQKVIARLLGDGPIVLATGGGAFMNEETRQKIAKSGVSIWLKADFDVLMRRVRKRSNRPLLQTADPEATLQALIDKRYPVYTLADVTVHSRDVAHEVIVEELLTALSRHLGAQAVPMPPSSASHSIVHVGLGDRAYDIVIGSNLLEEAGSRIAALAPGAACAIVTDETVAGLHVLELEESLTASGIRHARITVKPGEQTKSMTELTRVVDAILAAKMERGDLVIAVGGGVVGDLAGFAASITRRGMRFVQVPTTLLAQVDSSVGGKTGVNSEHGKNLIGAFHQPSLVLADTDCLDTLSPREFAAGYAEVVKYGLISDAPFFNWLEAHRTGVFAGGVDRVRAIEVSCAAKAAIVMRDEKEEGDRALLNLGHTFAHAFERIVKYDGTRLVHGEAVAIGLVCAFQFSKQLGLCHGQDVIRVEQHLKLAGLPTHVRDIPGWDAGTDAIMDAMAQDKKVKRGKLTFILARGIGESFIAPDVAADDVRSYLDAYLTASSG